MPERRIDLNVGDILVKRFKNKRDSYNIFGAVQEIDQFSKIKWSDGSVEQDFTKIYESEWNLTFVGNILSDKFEQECLVNGIKRDIPAPSQKQLNFLKNLFKKRDFK